MSAPAATANSGIGLQRLAAIGLILVQCALQFMVMQATVFPTLAAVVALGGILAMQHGALRRFHWPSMLILLASIYVGRTAYTPHEFHYSIDFINSSTALEISCFLISVQLLVIYSLDFARRIPAWFLALGVVACVFILDARVPSSRHAAVPVLVSAFVALLAAFCTSGRRFQQGAADRSRWLKAALMTVCCSASLVGGVVLSSLMSRYERELESMLTKYLWDQSHAYNRVGYSGSGGLYDVVESQLTEPRQIALRIFSERSPGYLRGRSFNRFEHEQWLTTIPVRARPPIASSPIQALREVDRAFPVASSIPDDMRLVDIWPDRNERTSVQFLPQDTALILSQADSIQMDAALSATCDQDGIGMPYTAAVGVNDVKNSGEIIDPALAEIYLEVPESLDGRFVDLAEELVVGLESDVEKMRRVQSYFHQNFTYRLGAMHQPDRQTVLSQFMFEEQAGHCELFATSTVLMLRLAHIPARYVTGYVADEKNEIGGFWVARRRHAHAWAEAYDRATGRWVLVESTPEDAIAPDEKVSETEQRREALEQQWAAMWLKLRSLRPFQVFSLLASPWLLVALGAVALIVTCATTFDLKTSFLRLIPSRGIESADPRLAAVRRQVDDLLRRQGWTRESQESLLDFAERLRKNSKSLWGVEAADWYQRYSRARYSKDNLDESIRDLKDEASQLRKLVFSLSGFLQYARRSRFPEPQEPAAR